MINTNPEEDQVTQDQAARIAAAIDWNPTCLPGQERQTIVRQILDAADKQPSRRLLVNTDTEGWIGEPDDASEDAIELAARVYTTWAHETPSSFDSDLECGRHLARAFAAAGLLADPELSKVAERRRYWRDKFAEQRDEAQARIKKARAIAIEMDSLYGISASPTREDVDRLLSALTSTGERQ